MAGYARNGCVSYGVKREDLFVGHQIDAIFGGDVYTRKCAHMHSAAHLSVNECDGK